MSFTASIADVVNGLRMLTLVLGVAILLWWSPCMWCVLRGIETIEQRARATWVPLAVAALLFDVRWLWPNLTPWATLQMQLWAHVAMATTLLCAIYIQGANLHGFKLRRTVAIHMLMLALCITGSVFAR